MILVNMMPQLQMQKPSFQNNKGRLQSSQFLDQTPLFQIFQTFAHKDSTPFAYSTTSSPPNFESPV